jgi:putative transposase
MLKSYKYRLYPNKAQTEKLQWTLDRCRELYNAALQERREAWKYARKSVTYNQQSAQLPEIKQIREEYQDIYAQVLQNVLQRVKKAYDVFFARCLTTLTSGHPRFKGRNQYDSFTYPQIHKDEKRSNGPQVEGDRIRLPKVGNVKAKFHRPLGGTPKTCTIKREGEQWYVVFACEIETHPLPVSYEDVGIDLGVGKLATLSTGDTIENPRYYRKSEKKLAKLHQSLDRKKRGSNRRKRAKQAVAKAYRKVANQRHDFLHKESHKLVNRYQVIVFEDLETANLVKHPKSKQDENGKYLPNGASQKAGLNKSILDAGWYEFVQYTSYKAANAGRSVLFVNPRYTSQTCSGCGTIKKKELSERWHSCECGTELDRDHNAAINILRAGRVQQARACEISHEVLHGVGGHIEVIDRRIKE